MTKTFNPEQYKLITECAQKEDFSEWNDYASKTKDIIDLRESNLEGIKIIGANFKNADGKGANFCDAKLMNAMLDGVDMSDCAFLNADLTGIEAFGSIFHESIFVRAQVANAHFKLCNFDEANFQQSNLTAVKFSNSNFQDCSFYAADLSGAKFQGGGRNPLVEGELRFNLCGTIFREAKFTSETYFHLAKVSRKTDFRTVSFESACYSAGLRQTLQYCNRRHNWTAWYEKHSRAKSIPAKLFWMTSDYGRSPKQVALSFLIICLFYSLLYWLIPGSTSGVEKKDLNIIQSLYFSIVTMTTLGYGDISANKLSWLSQALVATHVLFGYVILGALLTVLSNLFISDGPPEGLIEHPAKSDFRIRSQSPRSE
ncbi:Ion transporter [Pseudomonas syringae pv. philadelphi]|uniref:Ion transporter n=1 Tax=Pseudomonas syringae pv. philadelphi TaxID=251706 RepID=A0A3M3YVW6_9PSED|nr:pentapeptide repeat-containing protein [Pseudomonas syringae group genomosp. 3]RMO86702.1 Ion transporter [Pseudomonas syringae pv. philadelphi]